MNVEFTKMQALGNDFVVIDERGVDLGDTRELARKLCDRHFGVGADQVLLLGNSLDRDFRMRIFNADGTEVEMCGNGIRCLARYIWDRGLSLKKNLALETLAGTISPQMQGSLIRVDMGSPVLEGADIPVQKEGTVVDHPLTAGDQTFEVTCVSMGNPHAVIFVQDVENYPVTEYGPLIEIHPFFPKKTNVEFVQVMGGTDLKARVWERGVGETLGCGTGASAAAVAALIKGLVSGDMVDMHLRGGDLAIQWRQGQSLFMTGPAWEVFKGQLNINNIQGGRYV